MEIDWVVAVAVFLVFLSWALTFYGTISRAPPVELLPSIQAVQDQLIDHHKIAVTRIPVKFTAPAAFSSAIFQLDFPFPSENASNTTRVFQGTTSLPCNASGWKLFWQADAAAGDNFFSVRFSDQNRSLNCNTALDAANANKTYPWAQERAVLFSRARINATNGTAYDTFRSALGIARDFQLQFNISSAVTLYGPSPPPFSNVYVKQSSGTLEETDENVTVRALVW